MSKPKAPYYYKEGIDRYHQEISCSKNNYSLYDKTWIKTNKKPSKEQCNECKSK